MPRPVASMSLAVRPYRPEDRRPLIAMLLISEPWIQLGYTAPRWDLFFDTLTDGREAFVVDQGGVAAGLALVRRHFLMGDYLELLVVEPALRGKGLGQMLLKRVEAQVFARSKNLFVCVSDFNRDARRFYEQRGYQEVGPIPDLLKPGSSEILMRKPAGPATS